MLSKRLLFAVALLLLPAITAAQTQTSGEIFGKVTDATGALLPGVTVTISGPALLTPQSVTTAESGGYRFPAVPIGVYEVSFELPGFSRLVREGIRIETNFNAEVNAQLAVSSVQEEIRVSGEAPIVDTRATTTGATFTRELLDTLPSARDPWVVLEMTPGVVMDRQNVGGSWSGQQSVFTVHGGNRAQTMWNVDGATVTDMYASGASSTYFDFDAYEEIQIQTGGNDASLQTGGINLNLVTKSGGNVLRGSSRFFAVDNNLQSANVSAEQREQGAGLGQPIKNIKDYGVEIGGPIVRNKLWFWGSYGATDIQAGVIGFLKPGATDPNDVDSLETDETLLDNINGKLQAQVNPNQKLTMLYTFSDKVRSRRGASPTTAPESTTRQSGPSSMYKLSHNFVISDRLLLESSGMYYNGPYRLDFQSPELADVQRATDITTGMSYRSGGMQDFKYPAVELKSDASYYRPSWLGGDHSTKFGLRYRRNTEKFRSHQGGNATARFDNGRPIEADLHRDAVTETQISAFSAYATDSYKRGRVTLTAGLRLDYQDDEALPTSVPENPIIPDLLPPISFAGVDSGVEFLDLSPRFSATYDVRGDGKTVAKFNSAVYYGQGIYTASTLNPVGATTLRYGWSDLNGDGFVQRNELDLARGLLNSPSNYDPANPASPTTTSRVDPNLANERTGEILAGVDHELMRDFAVGAMYIWRRYDNFSGTLRPGLARADYAPFSFSAACGNTLCDQPTYEGTYFATPFRLPVVQELTNLDSHRIYNGVELTARKRMGDRWLLNGSVNLERTTGHYGDSDRAYQDPTNIEFLNGHPENSRNTRWSAKFGGLYRLPFDVNVSAFLNMRDGFPFNRTIQSPNRPNGLGRVQVLVRPYGTERYDKLAIVDLRVEKGVRVGKMRLSGTVDVFNALNANTVLLRTTQQNSTRANHITEMLAPRVARLGVRLTF